MSVIEKSKENRIKIENNFIYVRCTAIQAKLLDAVWVKSKNAWKLPNTLGALRELHRQGFDVMEYGKAKAFEREKLLNRKSMPFHIENLRPYQGMDINFLHGLPHAAVFNEQRTGKTPTTLKLIEEEGHEKVIIICPASLVLNWKKEIEQWTSLNAFAVTGTKTKRLKTYQEWGLSKGCLILSKDTLKADVDHLSPVSRLVNGFCMIVDEAHFLRNYKTAQSKAVFKLGKNATKRLALTGTPSVNKGDDIYGILHFLYPDRFTSYWAFVDRYFKTWDSPWGAKEVSGYKRKEELQEILDLISVQRKRADIMQWIPPKQYQTIEVEMDAKQRKAYNDMLLLFSVEEQGEVKVDAPSVLAQLTRLRQICLDPALLEINAPSAKEQFILEWLEDNPNEQVIIFSNFSSYLKTLFSIIPGSDLIIGETTKENRQRIVDRFQQGKTRIILANIQAAGVGLTLDAASTVIFLDRAYTPAENAQAEDRIVPTTENSNQRCTIIDVVCKNSIDQKINDLLSKKQSVIEVINNYGLKELMK